MSSAEPADVVVVGMGVGGGWVAERLAEAGLQVVGIESKLVGGECPYWGCIPSKMIVRAAGALGEARRVQRLAGAAAVEPDYAPVFSRIRDEATDGWDDRVAVERFEKLGGHFVRGTGRLSGPRSVEVGGRTFEATRALVLATGTAPFVPPIPGLDGVPYWTNREAIESADLPRSLVVLGGGAIGLELAQAYARFGVRVAIIEGADHVLALEEPEAGEVLDRVLRREGVALHVDARVTAVERGGDGVVVLLDDGQGVTAERLLVATGRRADLAALNLGAAGIDGAGRAVAVDGRLRAAPGVYAIGDITGRGAFTHVAMYQARIVIDDVLGRGGPEADYRALPRVTFTDPEVGATGLTEAQATERGIEVRTGLGKVSSSTRGWIHGPGNDGFIKLVEDAGTGQLVGATAMGPSGGEMMSMLCLAIQQRVPVESLRHMIFAYPTFHRGVEDALAKLAG